MDITFKVQFETQWGEEVFVCGSDESLGSWDPAKAFKLLYQPGSWSSVVHFANPNAVVQYKYLVKNTHDPNVPVKWEERENRVVSLKGRFKHQPMVVEEVWNQADRRVVPLNQQPGHNETHHDRQHQHTSKSKAERKARKDKRRALKKEREAREARQSQLAAKSSSSSTPSTSTTTEPAAPVEIPTWMQRTHMLLGNEQLSRLINCNVLVVGLGGVGAFAAEMVCPSPFQLSFLFFFRLPALVSEK